MPDKHTLSETPPVRYLELLARAVAHIGEHLAEPLDNERLAQQAAMSPFHFHRMFRAHLGTTVAGYVTWRRLQRACELLARDDAVVLEVALAVGYESAQALAKAMRRELDTTPTAVRAGAAPYWQRLFERRGITGEPGTSSHAVALQPRLVDLPEHWVLTATGRGMHEGRMARAAEQAVAELWAAVGQAGLAQGVTRSVGILPATGYALRDVPPFEHYLNDPRSLPPEQWRTDLHVPLL